MGVGKHPQGAMISKAAMDTCVQFFEWMQIFISFGEMPKAVIAGLCGSCMPSFIEK